MTQKPREFWIQKGTPDLIADYEDEIDRRDLPIIHVREVLPDENKINWEKVWEEVEKEYTSYQSNGLAEYQTAIERVVEKSLRGAL